jgi:predicted alpha/beta-fold hydrolase
MGVGWGYGANMLTKYLAEVGESTPLTAATCIDNPFDLDEATRAFPYHHVTDQKLTRGLVDILQTNKVINCFQFLPTSFPLCNFPASHSISNLFMGTLIFSYHSSIIPLVMT